MTRTAILLRIERGPDLDTERLDRLARSLRSDLLDLDVEAVRPVEAHELPPGAKGTGSLVGWLAVHLGSVGTLQKVVAAVRDWSSRTRRSVRIRIGDNEIDLSSATAAEQAALVEAFLALVRTDG